jgi:hypothetical protein
MVADVHSTGVLADPVLQAARIPCLPVQWYVWSRCGSSCRQFSFRVVFLSSIDSSMQESTKEKKLRTYLFFFLLGLQSNARIQCGCAMRPSPSVASPLVHDAMRSSLHQRQLELASRITNPWSCKTYNTLHLFIQVAAKICKTRCLFT